MSPSMMTGLKSDSTGPPTLCRTVTGTIYDNEYGSNLSYSERLKHTGCLTSAHEPLPSGTGIIRKHWMLPQRRVVPAYAPEVRVDTLHLGRVNLQGTAHEDARRDEVEAVLSIEFRYVLGTGRSTHLGSSLKSDLSSK
jgi:hypothetical protein